MGEAYPKDWHRVVLMVSPDGMNIHAIGGDRTGAPRTDGSYPALDLINKRIRGAGPFTEETPQGHAAVEAECAHMALDKAGVPRADEHHMTYSLWGRVRQYAATFGPKGVAQ